MTQPGIFDVIHNRRSIRVFKDEEISDEDLMAIAKAGKAAPSSVNRQIRKFTVVKNRELISKLGKAIGEQIYDSEYNFYGAKGIVLVSVPGKNEINAIEVGLAVQNMWLAATALNLGMAWTHQINGLSNEPKVRKVLNELEVPTNHICLNVMAVGIPAEKPKLKERREEIRLIK